MIIRFFHTLGEVGLRVLNRYGKHLGSQLFDDSNFRLDGSEIVLGFFSLLICIGYGVSHRFTYLGYVREALDNTQEEKDSRDVQLKSVLVEDIHNRESSSSSKDDEPFNKIDKDAILKSIDYPTLRNLLGDPSHFGSSSLE
ncbi:hypothetical protein FXO38_34132 [Capsicum annuum]|uniref:Uncharacterized protein n=1 Tax=Capsicum annuum TaxID=4072 RepID=A0A2G2ZX46_CAPAN|nr:hypothetical protein FXO38_34132 [Capsicum annuum]KAF3626252.1 hypothetical protein FXO37_30437 [Capsicum annuum]PHT86557.1 hypothetical protein T459_08663 [Capsicum annuum]